MRTNKASVEINKMQFGALLRNNMQSLFPFCRHEIMQETFEWRQLAVYDRLAKCQFFDYYEFPLGAAVRDSYKSCT